MQIIFACAYIHDKECVCFRLHEQVREVIKEGAANCFCGHAHHNLTKSPSDGGSEYVTRHSCHSGTTLSIALHKPPTKDGLKAEYILAMRLRVSLHHSQRYNTTKAGYREGKNQLPKAMIPVKGRLLSLAEHHSCFDLQPGG